MLRGQSIASRQGGSDGYPADSQVWAGEVTVGDELFCDDPGGVARDSKPQSLSHSAALAAAAHDERIDSNDLAGEVDERATGVALVDGRIRLDQTFQEKAFFYLDGAFRGADDAQRYGVCEVPQRRADSDHRLTRFQCIRVAPFGDGGHLALGLQHGQIRVDIHADQYGWHGTAIRQDDLDALSIFDHVIVGHDVAIFGDDDAGSRGAGLNSGAEEGDLSWQVGHDGYHRRANLADGLSHGGIDFHRH